MSRTYRDTRSSGNKINKLLTDTPGTNVGTIKRWNLSIFQWPDANAVPRVLNIEDIAIFPFYNEPDYIFGNGIRSII